MLACLVRKETVKGREQENENESQAEKGQELIQEPAKEYICVGVF